MGLLRRMLGRKHRPQTNAEIVREAEQAVQPPAPPIGAVSSERGGEAEAVTTTTGETRVQPLHGDEPPARQEKRCVACHFLVPLDEAGPLPEGGEIPDRHKVCPPTLYDWPEGEERLTKEEVEQVSYRERRALELMIPLGGEEKHTFSQVGVIFGISPERVRMIVNQTERKLLQLRAHKPFELPHSGAEVAEERDAEQDGAPGVDTPQRPSGDNGTPPGLRTAPDAGSPKVDGLKDPAADYPIHDPELMQKKLGEESTGVHVKGPGGKWISVYVGDQWEPTDPRRKGRVKVTGIVFGKGEHTGFDPTHAEVEIKSSSKAINGRKRQVKLTSFRPEISRGYKLVVPSEQREPVT